MAYVRRNSRGRQNNNGGRRRSQKGTSVNPMLSMGRLGVFKYDLKAILRNARVDENQTPSLIASIIAKASRISISEAKTYVKQTGEGGSYPKAVSDEICGLLDYYSKLR